MSAAPAHYIMYGSTPVAEYHVIHATDYKSKTGAEKRYGEQQDDGSLAYASHISNSLQRPCSYTMKNEDIKLLINSRHRQSIGKVFGSLRGTG